MSAPAADASTPRVEFHVSYTHSDRRLRVEAALPAGLGKRLEVERRAARWVSDVTWSTGGAPRAAGREGPAFTTGCGAKPCVVRYAYDLGGASRAIDDVDIASDEDAVVEAPPSTWLLAPTDGSPETRARFRVTTDAGSSFATGVYRAPDDPAAWEISLEDLETSPYSFFGPLRRLPVTTPRSNVDVVIAPGALALSDAQLRGWVESAVKSVVTYYDGFPAPYALVALVPGRGPWVGGGRTLAGGGATVLLRLGDTAAPHHLAEDWVLVHELVHLGFPSVARQHTWAEEGLATYVEPIARVRSGALDEREAWRGLFAGLPKGLPQRGDRGLDQTPTWGRTYWGGALFYLLADVELRTVSGNARGLEHALRGLVRAGGHNAARWPLGQALEVADRACGHAVLVPLHAKMARAPVPVDLDALERKLGVRRGAGGVTLDDAAPLAHIRRAIVGRP